MKKGYAILELYFWLALGILSILININEIEGYFYSTIIIGIAIMLHSFFYFVKHGGRYISPTCMYFFYSALIHGVGSIYINFIPSYTVVYGHYLGGILVYLLQVIVYGLFLVKNKNEIYYNNECTYSKYKAINIKNAIFILLLLFIIIRYIALVQFLESYVVYVVIILLAINLALKTTKNFILNVLLILLFFSAYLLFYFDGFGRINLATLLVGTVATIQYRLKLKNIKLLSIMLFYPAIIVASILRGGSIYDIPGGIGSIISPFYRFGQLLQMQLDGMLQLAYGKTIYAALAVFIPRSIWKGKPWNFNRQITEIFQPQLVQYGHSEASVLLAEMIYNFGLILGFVLTIVLIGVLLYKFDKTISNILQRAPLNNIGVMNLSIIILLSSGMLNLIWGGFSTYINRDGFKIIIVFVAFAPTYLFHHQKNELGK